MIFWDHISGDYTVESELLWTGQRGLFITRTTNPTYLYLKAPGKKVGAMLWVVLDPDTNASYHLRVYGSPTQAVIKPSATNYFACNNARSTAYFMATDENTWTMYESGLFYAL